MDRTNTVVFGKGLLATLGTPFVFSVNIYTDGRATHEGEDHRRQRKVMNPVFSTSHIRSMSTCALGTSES